MSKRMTSREFERLDRAEQIARFAYWKQQAKKKALAACTD